MKYLFYVAKLYSIPIIQPLAQYLIKNNEEFAFFVSKKVYEKMPSEWNNYPVFNNYKQAKYFHPDFVLCPGNFVDFRIPGIKVQIFHGLGVEKEAHYKIRHFFDVYLTSGPFVTKRFLQLQKRYGYFLVFETGWPKIDYILNFPTDNLKQKYGIPEDKKIILYAPTFSKRHESATALLNTIPSIIREDEFWICKFHELMDNTIIERFKQSLNHQSLIIQNEEITPYLHAADLMISDTSSVIYEFMVLDKPIVTYRTQARKNKGIDITEPSQLREAIDISLANPQEFHELRMKHLEEINPALDGKISERVFQTLQNIYRENLLPSKRKPLNLFRKMQVIYHSIFKKGYLR